MDRTDYYRIMALGCLDALLLFPIGIYNITVDVLQGRPLPFWTGWAYVHTDWEPFGLPSSVWEQSIWDKLVVRWDEVINPALALVFFLIFGLTREARWNYWVALTYPLRPFGIRPCTDTKKDFSEVVFRSENPGATGAVTRTEFSTAIIRTTDQGTSDTDSQPT